MQIKPFPSVRHIRVIPIPMPGFPDLKTANVYVVGAGPITLIDTGPKYPTSLNFLTQTLQTYGFNLSDVERIIITHGHVDHFGLAAGIRREAGKPIPCYVHAEDAWRLSTANLEEDVFSDEALDYMARMDLPEHEIARMRRRYAMIKDFCDPLDDYRLMEGGAAFAGDGYHLRVIHTPGHSPGNCCIYECEQHILFSGDHILKHTTPNPLMEISRSRLKDPGYQSLPVYLASLDKLGGLAARYAFPGHGGHIEDLPAIIAAYHAHHRKRLERIWHTLRRGGPRAIYQLMGDIFPRVPEGDVMLAVSETAVHMEMLVKVGRAELIDPGPPELYRAL